MKPLSLNGSFFFLVYSSFLYAHPQVVPPATCTCFFSKKIWPRPLPCTTWTKRECKRICAERCPSYVLQHIRFPYVASLKSLNCSTLGTRGFSRGRRDLSALAEGWHIFGRRPKPRTGQKPRLEKSLAPRRSRVRIPYKPEFFLAFFCSCEKLCQKCDDLLSYNSADFVKSLKTFRGERFCRALLGQMFNSWCISCTIYNMHSRDCRLGFTIL